MEYLKLQNEILRDLGGIDFFQPDHVTSLVEGEFTAKEARNQVLHLIMARLNYLSREKFRSEAYHHDRNTDINEEIQSLQHSKQCALELFELAKVNDLNIRIDLDINIHLVNP